MVTVCFGRYFLVVWVTEHSGLGLTGLQKRQTWSYYIAVSCEARYMYFVEYDSSTLYGAENILNLCIFQTFL
jgi:hypothetical protein